MDTAVTHQAAITEFVDADGVAYAYRRFGQPGKAPLVLLADFRGNLDGWDPALTDALAAGREIVLVDAPGVGASTGAPKHSVAETAQAIIAFLDALGLREIDLLGFSLGGFVAQDIALLRPWSVRRLILAGTGPRGAPGMHGWPADVDEHPRHDGISAAREAQYDAMLEWGVPDHAALQRLTGIESPTLILHGDDDLMIPTKIGYLMAGLIPHAELRIYPDAGHASIFQSPEDVARDINAFLDAPVPAAHEAAHHTRTSAAPSDGRRSRARDRARESADALALEPYSPPHHLFVDLPRRRSA
jgi:pimeloyl-ACP methyl ester carboxylesterase